MSGMVFSGGILLFFLRRKHLIPLGVFVGILLITAGPLVFSLLLLNARDPLLGFHSPVKSSLDLLAPIIPGGHWYFAQLTEPFWSKLTVNIHESSVHMGISVLFLLSYVWLRRGQCRAVSVRLLVLCTHFLCCNEPRSCLAYMGTGGTIHQTSLWIAGSCIPAPKNVRCSGAHDGHGYAQCCGYLCQWDLRCSVGHPRVSDGS